MSVSDLTECINASCHQLGLHLRLGYYPLFPYNIVSEDKCRNESQLNGLLAENIIPFILGSLNFTYEFRCTEYSSLAPNLTWTGDFGMLQRKELDISIGPYSNEEERSRFFRSLQPYNYLDLNILASAGKTDVYDFSKFLFKVNGPVWYMLFLAFALLIVSSAISETYSSGKGIHLSLEENMNHCFWLYLAALFCEGSPRIMITRLGKLQLILWLFAVLIFMNALVGQFKSVLMVKSEEGLIRTIEDLSNRPDLIPLMVEHSVLQHVFRDSSLETYRQVYSNAMLSKKESLITIQEYLNPASYQKVKNGKYVMVTDEENTKSLLSVICPLLKGNRKLYFIEESFYLMLVVIYINRDVPKYLESKINERIFWMNEGGFFKKWISYYFKDYYKCDPDVQSGSETLEMKHLAQVFYLLAACHAVALLLFALEIMHNTFTTHKKNT